MIVRVPVIIGLHTVYMCCLGVYGPKPSCFVLVPKHGGEFFVYLHMCTIAPQGFEGHGMSTLYHSDCGCGGCVVAGG